MSLTEIALRRVHDYVKDNTLKAQLEIDANLHNLLESDMNDLLEKVRDAQRRGRLVRGYHY